MHPVRLFDMLAVRNASESLWLGAVAPIASLHPWYPRYGEYLATHNHTHHLPVGLAMKGDVMAFSRPALSMVVQPTTATHF